MPRRPRPGDWEILYCELPGGLRLKRRLARQAARNGRTVPAELARLLDRALDPDEDEPKTTDETRRE